jgi:hypothetical protein
VQAIHERRFGRPLPIPKNDYLAFVENAETVLKEFGLRVTLNAVADLPPAAVAPAGHATWRSYVFPVVLLVCGLAAAISVGWALTH